ANHRSRKPDRVLARYLKPARKTVLVALDSIGPPQAFGVIGPVVPLYVLPFPLGIACRHAEAFLFVVIGDAFDHRYPRTQRERNKMTEHHEVANRDRRNHYYRCAYDS